MEQTLATIMGWGATFAPRSWAFCHGQLLAISSNDALFSLIGTIYGGDGRTSFALPDMRGRAPVSFGQSPGTSFWPIGARIGSETNTLTQLNLPVHNHAATLSNDASAMLVASSSPATTETPSTTESFGVGDADVGGRTGPARVFAPSSASDTTLHPASVNGSVAIGNAGGSQSFEIVQPVQAIHWIIALFGLYPSRN